MERSSVVFLSIKNDASFTLPDITTLQVHNRGNVNVSINKIVLFPNQRKTLVVADGTLTNFDLEITFDKRNSKSDIYSKFTEGYYLGIQELEIIYKKVISCKN